MRIPSVSYSILTDHLCYVWLQELNCSAWDTSRNVGSWGEWARRQEEGMGQERHCSVVRGLSLGDAHTLPRNRGGWGFVRTGMSILTCLQCWSVMSSNLGPKPCARSVTGRQECRGSRNMGHRWHGKPSTSKNPWNTGKNTGAPTFMG